MGPAFLPPLGKPSAVPVGPSVERWRQMSPADRDRFFDQVYNALNHPLDEMSMGRPHSRARSAAMDALGRHFKTIGRAIYLADELAVIYPGEPSFSPDLLAVLDVPQPDPQDDERMAWVVADEGKGPDFILEVLHRGDRKKDLETNVEDYARLGIREYFVYDRLNFKLYGYRLARTGTHYLSLRPKLGRMTSEVLGLDLALVQRRLRFFYGLAEVPESDEFIDRLSTMMEGVEARAEAAEAQVQAAEAQARAAAAKAQAVEAQARAAAAQGILDMAELLGIEITPERRQLLADASPETLADLRMILKTRRAWP